MPKGVPDGKKTVTVTMSEREYEALRKSAFDNRVTMSAFSRDAIIAHGKTLRERAAAEREAAKKKAAAAAKKSATPKEGTPVAH